MSDLCTGRAHHKYVPFCSVERFFHYTLIVKRLHELHTTSVSLRCVVEARAQFALERMGRHAAGSALEDAARDASS